MILLGTGYARWIYMAFAAGELVDIAFTLKRSQKEENLVSKPSSLKLSINRVSLNCQSTFEFLLLVFVEGSL